MLLKLMCAILFATIWYKDNKLIIYVIVKLL